MMPPFDTALLRHIAERHQPLPLQERKAAQLPRKPLRRWLQNHFRRLPLHLLPKFSRRRQASINSPF